MTTTDEHPQGDEIRRQVEYYFSDENLPHDAHMLGLTGGSENLPVSFSRISGFSKMQKYKPRLQVKASLRKSTFIEFTDDKHIRRRVPLSPSIELKVEPEVIARSQKSLKQALVPEKPWLTKGMLKPTGFEEYFADAPLTPAEHAENLRMYDRHTSFATRIETAVQRYQTRRKFHSDTAFIFGTFLSYGGIQTGARQFVGGLSKQDMQDMDKEQLAAMTSTYGVPEAVLDEDLWEVDFAGIARGFLSTERFDKFFSSGNPAAVGFFTNILSSFYRWLLYHDVCNEYKDQLEDAVAICKVADKELPFTIKLTSLLPDQINEACATLGYDSDDHEAKTIVMAALAAYESPMDSFEAVKSEEMCIEVTAVEFPSEEVREVYRGVQSMVKSTRLVGRLHCGDVVLWVEERLLKHCFIGMKIEGLICTSSSGQQWLGRLYAANPSYHKTLHNDTYEPVKGIFPKAWWKRERLIREKGWQTQAEILREREDC